VCPLVLSKQVMERLGPDADKVVFILITVDSERDLFKYVIPYSS
jgi:cytochrome oxidase Cu insertion factor (SCO1/SenC/PrrC family)